MDVSLTGAEPHMTSSTVIATGYIWGASVAPFIQGPTGDALGKNGTLHFVDTITNTVNAVSHARTRLSPIRQGHDVIAKGGSINGSLGLTAASNGDVIVGEREQRRRHRGLSVGERARDLPSDSPRTGDLFGLAIAPDYRALLIVNDGTNALDEVTFGTH